MAKNKYILKALAILSIIMVSIFVLTGCGKNNEKKSEEDNKNYQEPLINYFDGIKNKNPEQVIKAFPAFMNMDSKIKSEDIDEFYAYYESLYGSDVTMDYSIGDAVKLGDDEISELEDEIKAVYNVENIELSGAYSVTITVTFQGSGVSNSKQTEGEETDETTDTAETAENSEEVASKTDTEQDDMYVILYEGNWYLL